MDNLTYRKWLKLYRKAHAIKKPGKKASKLEWVNFFEKINPILRASSLLLNKVAPLPKPLWVYKLDDETTRPSSDKFSYKHLLANPESQGACHVI